MFSSEEDDDGNVPESDEDGHLDDNSETNEDGGTRTSGPKTHLKWTITLNIKELGKYENLSGPKHSLPVGSGDKHFFELFVTNDFYNKFTEETNKYAALPQRNAVTVDINLENTNAYEIRTYVGILIYMGLVDLPDIEDYFQGDFCNLSYSETSHESKTIPTTGTIYTSE
jgi:hypothetical protein